MNKIIKQKKIKNTRNKLNIKNKKYHENTLEKIDDIILSCLEKDKMQIAIKNIYKIFNKSITRVKENHFLIRKENYAKLYHRAIFDISVLENSREGIKNCVKAGFPFEVDVTLYKGKVVLYHSDKYSSKLGQEASMVDKENIEYSISLEEALEITNGKVPIIIDLKAYHIFGTSLEKEVIKLLKNYKGEYTIQSFNPLSLKYFAKHFPKAVRGQLGNSLTAVKRTKRLRYILLIIVNFVLFYQGHPDYIVYDLDETVDSLSKINNILGFPIIGYTARCDTDIEKYKVSFDNFFVEGQFKMSN